MQFDTLTQIALLGTERQGLPTAQTDSPLGEVLARVDLTQREQALLRAAAHAPPHGPAPPGCSASR